MAAARHGYLSDRAAYRVNANGIYACGDDSLANPSQAVAST